VVVGQDVAVRADDDAGAQAGILARLAFRAVAEEVAEDRVVEQRVALLAHDLRGVDMHHGRQGGAGCIAIGAAWRLAVVVADRGLLQGDDCLALGQPFGLERGDDEQNGKRNSYRLCKNQPQPLHGIVSNEA
jgi:hypothetical protein